MLIKPLGADIFRDMSSENFETNNHLKESNSMKLER